MGGPAGAAAIVEEAGRHPCRLTGGTPRRAPAADGNAVAVEDQRTVGVAPCPPLREARRDPSTARKSSTRLCAVLHATRRIVYNPATMTDDEREHLLSTVGQAHAGLSEVALKLRLGLSPNTPARKTAMKAERAAFELKRALQRLDVKDVASITRREALFPEVRRGGKVVDIASLLRHTDRHDEP